MAIQYKLGKAGVQKKVEAYNPDRYQLDTQGFEQQAPDQVGVDQSFSNNQMALANSLQNQANGTGPSVAQNQLQQGTDANIAQQMAMAASGRGTNLGMSQKLAATNAANAQQQLAGQAATARLQEQQQAQQLLSGVNTSGMTNATNTANIGVTQRGQDIGVNTGNQQAALTREQLNQQGLQTQNQQQLDWAKELKEHPDSGGGFWSKLSSIAGGVAGAVGGVADAITSDEDLKKDIKPADKKIKNFLDKVKAYDYEYKNAADGVGRFVSPMAQDLEKTNIGDSMVEDTPHGKMVNYSRALGTMLAGQGYLNDRLNDIEKALKTKKRLANAV